MFYLIVVIAVVVLFYIQISKPHKYWKEKGIRYVKPWPLFGYMAPNIFRFKSFAHVLQDLYNTFPKQRYFGCYQFLAPTLYVRDPDLIKTIMVKEFDTFPEHRTMIDAEADPLFAKNLFVMRGGDEWRDMRSTLSPAFTSSKMRTMFGLMKEAANQLTEHLLNQSGTISLEMKDLTTRFANDVIASTAFGISCNSLKNPKNDFYLMTKQVTDFSISRMLKFLGYTISPSLMKLFKFRMFGETTSTFYRNLIKETIKLREETEINRPDMIQLLLEARKGRLIHQEPIVLDSGFAVVQESEIGQAGRRKAEITDDDITAQALLFFFAGFETVSTTMSHLTHELALNPKIQERLREEVDRVQGESGSELTYEALLHMQYLDMVVSETLRKWPPAVVTTRKSVRPITIEPKMVWETTLHLEEGSLCMLPIFAIHRDPKYYPEPDKFDPERFSDTNKSKIKPFTYLPFGGGPRNCIGSRFALLEIKTFIFHVLSEFAIVPTEKTQNPVILSKKAFGPVPDQGFWVGLKPRHKKTA